MNASAVTAVLLVLCVARSAVAEEDRERCLRAYDQSQRLRQQVHLVEARVHLAVCAAEVCPAAIRDDCVAWFHDVDAATPTLIISASLPDGSDVADARVFIDDVVVAERLTGAPLPVDPGERRIRIEHRGSPRFEQTVVVDAGEKNRLLRAVLPVVRVVPPPPSPVGGGPAPSVTPFVVGGLGLAGTAAGGALALLSAENLHHFRTTCAPQCNPADVDSTRALMITGDALLAVGAATLAAAVWLWVRDRQARANPAVGVLPMRSGSVLTFMAEF